MDHIVAQFPVTRDAARDARSAVAPESRQRALFLRLQAFLQENLGDRALSPDTVAAAHHIPTRYLHRLFQRHGATVAGWTRDRRLERCRRELADPACLTVPVHEIAGRWGFSHPSVFSRAFRAAYGASPQEYRRACAQRQ